MLATPLEWHMPFATRRSRFRPGLVFAFALAGTPQTCAAAAPPRVIVLGFDGADHALVAKGIAEGRLPNLAALAAKGGFSALNPTIPAQTPVSWSTFSTGLSPGRTMIFDFLKRNPKTYRPEFAIAEEGKKNFLLGKGNRVGVPAVLGTAGVRAGRGAAEDSSQKARGVRRGRASLVAALAAGGALHLLGISFSLFFPPKSPGRSTTAAGRRSGRRRGGRESRPSSCTCPSRFPPWTTTTAGSLSGLGVTDVRGRVGTPSYYTSDPFFAPKNKNEFSVELVRLESNRGTIETEVFGPYNKLFKEPPVIRTPMTLTLAADGGSLTVAPKGSSPVTLKPGEWSPLGRLHVPVQLPREDDGHRALPPRVRLARRSSSTSRRSTSTRRTFRRP